MAKFNLGCLYFEGIIVEKNHKKAFILFQEAANLGHLEAQQYLKAMTEEGLGLPTDKS
jgi:TPR repeat protein